jgi:hypothetical protein
MKMTLKIEIPEGYEYLYNKHKAETEKAMGCKISDEKMVTALAAAALRILDREEKKEGIDYGLHA